MTIPKQIGKYEIIEGIGRGGFAEVYRARDPSLGRMVALKVLHSRATDDPVFVQRFKQEACTAAQFDHPRIVTVFDVGEDDGQHYIAMTYLPGRGLDERLEEAGGPLPLEQVVSIVEQVAEGLDYIHRRGSVHRDVKPANVMVSEEGRATLLDFGIVRAADGTPLTTFGEKMGTPQYMSPEQAEGREVDHRSDVYALGVVAYQMCAGRAPFDDVSPLVVLRLHADKAPQPPDELNPDLPPQVARVILKALAKDPEERYQSAGEFAGALRGALVEAEQARWWEASMPPWVWPVGGMGVLGLLIGFVWVVFGSGLIPLPSPATSTPTQTNTPRPSNTPTATPTPSPSPTWPADVPPPNPSLHDTWTRPADGMTMVYVPGGTFQMGSEDGDDDEQPVHEVTVDGFWLDQTEVTNAQFVAFLNEQGNQTEGGFTWLDLEDEDCLIEQRGGDFDPKSGYVDHPVIEVSWYGAAAYCEWAGGRLPTEAEWEYAARGEEGRKYPWGNEDPTCDLAQYNACEGKTVPVGSFPEGASWCDALDMAGNVSEWVEDWYGDYPSGPQVNPTGPDAGDYRVLRGGSWYNDPEVLRGAIRGWDIPGDWGGDVGFRCARGS